MPSPIEARFNLSPSMWEPQSTRCKFTISYECLSYKYDQRKEVVDFANAISSRLSWKHEIFGSLKMAIKQYGKIKKNSFFRN